jgi:site-specific DNA-methyltransferase (adenine-specific)
MEQQQENQQGVRMKLINADCIAAMKEMHSNSIDSIVTDPPYELGFMGKSWDASGIAFNIEVWKEALRILKPGGHLIAFSGSRTYHRMAVAIEDAGFQIRDQIMWIYGSGFPKSRNLKDEWQGWGTALKPAHEPMVLARKPLISTVANNVLKFGVGALNIDASRVEGKLEGDPNRFTKTDGDSFNSFSTEQPIVRQEGRWPANVIHDGSDEVVALFPDVKGKLPFTRLSNFRFNVGETETGAKFSSQAGLDDSGSAARFFYCSKASKRDRNEGALNNHPTVKPTSLMQYLVKLVTPPNGTVLDPFMGSGSTGKACVYEGFDFIGIDQSAEYVEIAQARIDFALEELNK